MCYSIVTSEFKKSLCLLTYAQRLLSKQALFFLGGSPRTRAASYLCLTGDDSISYDRSFAWVPKTSELNCCTAVYYLTVFLSWHVLFACVRIQKWFASLEHTRRACSRSECCFFREGSSFRTRAAACRDVCLYWGGISFTTARWLVPPTCLVKTFSPEIAK